MIIVPWFIKQTYQAVIGMALFIVVGFYFSQLYSEHETAQKDQGILQFCWNFKKKCLQSSYNSLSKQIERNYVLKHTFSYIHAFNLLTDPAMHQILKH